MRKYSCILMFITSIVLFWISEMAYSASVIAPSLEDMTINSEYIVFAEVFKVTSRYARNSIQEKSSIYTNYELKILKTYKGQTQEKMVITQDGGCVLDRCFSTSLERSYLAGDRAIFFLHRFGTDQIQHYFGMYSTYVVNNQDQLVSSNESLTNFENKIYQHLQSGRGSRGK